MPMTSNLRRRPLPLRIANAVRGDVPGMAMEGATHAQAAPPHMSWVPPAGLVDLAFMNAILKVVTLGGYQFWAKTEVRKRIWSAIRIEGEPLEYSGTGKELFIGFLFAFGAVLIPVLLISVALSIAAGRAGSVAIQTLVYIGFIYLFGVGLHRAQRYRLTRTRWRGIRGGLEGSAWRYGWTSLWTALLIPITFGWIYPWRATRLQRLLVENIRFGESRFSFDENSGPLYGRFIALWIFGLAGLAATGFAMAAIVAAHSVKGTAKKAAALTPEGSALMVLVVLAAYLLSMFASSWYRAGQFNHFARSTSFAGAPLRATMTGGGLLWLQVSNFLIVVTTFGILSPIAQARSARYFVEHLAFDGAVDLEQIAQSSAAAGGKTGEGLAQAFDFDAF
jgi:uncharacterized membrane protein YjgN (DUF898 family)